VQVSNVQNYALMTQPTYIQMFW